MPETKIIDGELIVRLKISNLIEEDQLQEIYQGCVYECIQDIAQNDGLLRNVDPDFCQILGVLATQSSDRTIGEKSCQLTD